MAICEAIYSFVLARIGDANTIAQGLEGGLRMPIITVTFKEMPLAEYRVEAGKTLTIGRKEGNDVVIDNLAVSGYHAKIDAIGDAFFLTDLQSKNGSFVNQIKISSHRLSQGDVITIGKHTLTFSYAAGELQPDKAASGMDQTMVMDTNQQRFLLEKNAPPADKKRIAALTLLSGGMGDIGITKKLFKIGKSAQNDLQVNGFFVGQIAATISQRPSGYFLNYVEGMSKPKVNGKVIRETIQLQEFDIIEIGKNKMQIVFKS
jgi:pSer/pThr/pTyr-binding forkhead associated (FHA) protein